MSNISGLLASRVMGNCTQQRTGNYTSKANQNQTFADILAAIKQPQTTAQSQTAASASRTNPIEEQQRIIQSLLNSQISAGAKGNYPTEEQLELLREKYKDAGFSVYHTYNDVSQHAGGGLTWTTGTGFSDAHNELIKDLYDMGILSDQDKGLLSLEIAHMNIHDLRGMRGNYDNLSAFDKYWYEWDIPEHMLLSGRGKAFDIIEYYRGRAELDRKGAEHSANASEPIYQLSGASMNADLFSSAAEARERVANILDAIINGAELPA